MDADLTQLTRPDRTGWTAPWLAWLDLAVHREILRLRARYELSMDELRGLYVSDEQVDRLVRREAPSPDVLARMDALDEQRQELLVAARRHESPLAEVANGFCLGEPALTAMLVCLAPEMDLSYQSIYAYLNDDVARRLPTVDLCARLSGSAVGPDDPLLELGLVEAVRVDAAPLWRSAGLVLSEPLRRFLLEPGGPASRRARRAHRIVVLESRSEEEAAHVAARVVGGEGELLVRPDPGLAAVDPDRALGDALLTARLRDATLFVTPADLGLMLDAPPGAASVALCRRLVSAPIRVVIAVGQGQAASLPVEGAEVERIVVGLPGVAERTALWRTELERAGVRAHPGDVEHVAGLFALGAVHIAGAARTVARGRPADGTVERAVLARAARERSRSGLERIAEEVPTVYRWEDLVLPVATQRRIREIGEAVRHRHRVFDTWSFGRLVGGHASVRALFSGPSGTGKTMSATVLAGDLGLALYRVDLSRVVSKYVGETEKNIERILIAAESSNAILLFDEADALFGKRTEVKDAHDRYANIETAFLLQRIENFDGVVILATNLAGNLDEAFGRRIHFQVEFPVPDEALRAKLWRLALPGSAPVADDFDPDFLARMFPMTGGGIRNASLMAAFMAAREGEPIGMLHIVRALARQRRQQGKVPSAAEFREYLRLIRDEES